MNQVILYCHPGTNLNPRRRRSVPVRYGEVPAWPGELREMASSVVPDGDATAAVLDDDGWFYTGDLATRTVGGAIRILGRRSTDLIKTGGYRVGAGEIEACLLEHPSVREAAVVGVPDDDLGQRIAAFVVLRPGEAEDPAALSGFVAEHLSPHKRPRATTLAWRGVSQDRGGAFRRCSSR